MCLELDHLFACTALGALEAEKLVQFGLQESPKSVCRTRYGSGSALRPSTTSNSSESSPYATMLESVDVTPRAERPLSAKELTQSRSSNSTGLVTLSRTMPSAPA